MGLRFVFELVFVCVHPGARSFISVLNGKCTGPYKALSSLTEL